MSAMQARLSRLGDSAERDIRALWRRQLAGAITQDQLVAMAAAVLARANGRAVVYADLALTAQIIRELRQPASPLGLAPLDTEVDRRRLSSAVRTVLAAEVASVTTAEELAASRGARLARLARAEPQSTMQDALGRAMTERQVPGWVRETEPNACPLCDDWADGEIRPPTVRMARHTGCACVPRPVLTRSPTAASTGR